MKGWREAAWIQIIPVWIKEMNCVENGSTLPGQPPTIDVRGWLCSNSPWHTQPPSAISSDIFICSRKGLADNYMPAEQPYNETQCSHLS